MLSANKKVDYKYLIDVLMAKSALSDDHWQQLLSLRHQEEVRLYLAQKARETRDQIFGKRIYLRGLIEFTNICKNDCYYCGIRRSNSQVERYRLSVEDILSCCEQGYSLGFRTFVLQGGEDPYWSDERLVPLVETIYKKYADCAITLSTGERTKESYQALFKAGARRYLLRHETADEGHYKQLHPALMSLENRLSCLKELRSIGFQTGCGFMVGSPGQTIDHLVKDFLFMQDLKPQMVGIGPFIPHKQTPFKDKMAGNIEETLFLLSLLRLMLPNVLLPATTALGTIAGDGRERGIFAGANVIMPNLSPQRVREKYQLYDGKLATGSEAAESVADIRERLERIGYIGVVDRGDHPNYG